MVVGGLKADVANDFEEPYARSQPVFVAWSDRAISTLEKMSGVSWMRDHPLRLAPHADRRQD